MAKKKAKKDSDEDNGEIIEQVKIKAYALENAVRHNGVAVQGAVINSLFADGLEKKNINKVIPFIQKVLKEVNSLSVDEQKKEFDEIKELVKKRKVREGLPELPGAENGKVMMRFAPFPSGPIHIGNTRQLILNDKYAKTYNGKLILVIDDTIGSEEKPINKEAYKLIEEGAKWLGIKYDKIVYKSDRLEKYYAYAEELIKKGYMYVCSCSREEMQDLRKKGIECACRRLPPNKQLEKYKKMFRAREGEYTIRLKTLMSHPNPSFRDRVMFKISEREHPRVGKKYRVWPLLEFSWAIDDHLLKMTHIIRGIDLMMETKVEEFIWDIFQWAHPKVIHTGLFAIQGLSLSKSKGAQEVKSGKYIGWNDPRTWSLQSLRDRGIQPEAIREFILNMGITKVNSTIAVNVLYALNKKYLGKVAQYFFVENPVKILINGCPKLEYKEQELGQEFLISGEDMEMMGNGNYRLIHFLNFKSAKVGVLDGRSFSFLSSGKDNLDVKNLQWLPVGVDNVKVELRMPDNKVVKGLGEVGLRKVKNGRVVYFEGVGYARLYKKNKDSLEFWFAHR